MYLAEYLSKFCEENKIQLIIKNLSSAAIKISKIIRLTDNPKAKFETKNIDSSVPHLFLYMLNM